VARTEAASCLTCSDSGACACSAGLTCGSKGACLQCTTASQCEPPTCAAAECTGGGCLYMPASQRAPCGDGGLCTTSGACVECLETSDCPMSVNGCTIPMCDVLTGACGFTAVGSGSACGGAGHCDGRGNCNECSCAAPAPCALTTCDGGCGMEPAPRGTSCDAGGPGVCTGAGMCAECNFATDCAKPTKPCTVATCEAYKCGAGNAPANTPCGAANSGNVCNGAGACVECTPNHTAACAGSAPYCGPNGTCVACTSPSQCKGTLPVTCLNNVCVGINL
jgi:hypothetical protein